MKVKDLCLGALYLGDASGYEIRKLFEQGPFSHFAHVSFGSIYPALGQLLKNGLVRCRKQVQDGKPDKKIYSLTETGLAQLTRALNAPPGPDKFHSDTLFMLFFADLMPRDKVQAVLDEYITHFTEAASILGGLDNENVSPPRQHVRAIGQAFYQTMADTLQHNRDGILSSLPKQPLTRKP